MRCHRGSLSSRLLGSKFQAIKELFYFIFTLFLVREVKTLTMFKAHLMVEWKDKTSFCINLLMIFGTDRSCWNRCATKMDTFQCPVKIWDASEAIKIKFEAQSQPGRGWVTILDWTKISNWLKDRGPELLSNW